MNTFVRGVGRIRVGAAIFQDHRFVKWPACCPPKKEYEGVEYQHEATNPEMLFEVVWRGSYWECKADGYGHLRSAGDSGEYGNGSILVGKYEDVELVEVTIHKSSALGQTETSL